MSARIGRNDPCPCGSGKKYKRCCEVKSPAAEAASTGNGVVVLVLILIVGGVAATFFVPDGNDSPTTAATAVPTPSAGSQPQRPGQVWSQEHGHWHDAATGTHSPATTSATPVITPTTTPGSSQPIAQPEGDAPEGKVWSPEHGHWHDKP